MLSMGSLSACPPSLIDGTVSRTSRIRPAETEARVMLMKVMVSIITDIRIWEI